MDQDISNYTPNSFEHDDRSEVDVTPEQEAEVMHALQNKKELSFEERRIMRAISKRKRDEEHKWCEEHGIKQEVLFDQVCRTSPANLELILNEAFSRLKFTSPSFVDDFEIEKWYFEPKMEFKLSFSKLGSFGAVGTIYATQVNDINMRIEVVCSGELLPFMDREDAADLYWMALRALHALIKEICLFLDIPYKVPNVPSPALPGSQIQSGREREPEYDLAFIDVRHYISEEKLKKKAAYKKAYKNYLERANVIPDKYTYDNFRSAMNYRLDKDGL